MIALINNSSADYSVNESINYFGINYGTKCQKPKDIHFTWYFYRLYDKEKQQTITIKKLELDNIWYFCLIN